MDNQTASESVQPRYIDNTEALQQLCEQIKDEPWITLDTEFLRERTYFPKLCLIQLAVPGLLACIDPLALDDLDPLADILFDSSIVKVFHACSQDQEIFYHLFGKVPGPIFDTQIAAPLLGLQEQIGYAALVKQMLGVELDKAHSRTDWSTRPLSDKQLDYALDDVRYLCKLYQQIISKLEESGRLDWLDSDFQYYETPERYENNPDKAWLRIRGYERLGESRLSVLQTLAKWREQTAREEDRPRNWIMRDDAILDLARLQPENRAELTSIRNIPEKSARKYADVLLAMIKEASAQQPEPAPIRTRRSKPGIQQEALADVLHAQLTLLAEQHSINPMVIATRKHLVALAGGERQLPLLEGWRYQLAGKEVLALLEGKRTLSISDNRLHIDPV